MFGVLVGVLVVLLGLLYAAQSAGLVSSNDGSHVALGRALVLRGETSIEPDVGLTLWVDRARRDGKDYSDRPPGTAFAALPAIWLGARVDRRWGEASVARLKAGADPTRIEDVVVARPATDRYIATYGARRVQTGDRSPNLIALQGTAVFVGLHCGLMGALGLAVILALLRRRGVDVAGQCLVVVAIGGGTLWGPYSTMLFSHVTAGTMLVGCLWGLESMRDADTRRRRWIAGALAGLAGGWAVSTDYALLVVAVPLVLLVARPGDLHRVALGAVPIALATAAYHDAAFGSPLSIGYDHHATFDFATSRAATFSGNPAVGAWALWGAGQGSGALVMAPVMLVAAAGLIREPRIGLALLPWALLLCFHQTPAGGAGQDHRYLVPAIGVLGVGLGCAWRWFGTRPANQATALRGGLVVIAAVSAVLVWTHFFAWRG